jgi:superfamily I DNA/RNA helicase
MQLHKLDRAKDANFWSVRVSRDVRVIVHKTPGSLLLCYAGHHDDAYRWAERRKLERHPVTGAAQFVEVREMMREVTVPVYVTTSRPAPPKRALLTDMPEQELLAYGVPADWMEDVQAATEDSILEIADHLPREAAEAVLELATGGRPKPATVAPPDTDPFQHPDALSRFRVMTNVEALSRALEYPWEKWSVFLHPAQRDLVERAYNGSARISGSAGTGKTIVALHRAVHLTRRHPDARVLLTTFSDPLAAALRLKLCSLIGNEPRIAERLEVEGIGSVGQRIARAQLGPLWLVDTAKLRQLLTDASAGIDLARLTPAFLWDEWRTVVDAWQVSDWESYRNVKRLGRKARLAESQREVIWSVFAKVHAALDAEGLTTESTMFAGLANHIAQSGKSPFEYAVIDESQDLTVSQLRFLAALGCGREDALFFTGDLGQRIFQTPFSWRSLGVDIRGRSHTLRVCYRTSHQIRRQADRLLPPEMNDVDENAENRRGTVSVFNGPPPELLVLETREAEAKAIAAWIERLSGEGIPPHEIGIFVRSDDELPRAQQAAKQAGTPACTLDDTMAGKRGHVTIATMHSAKGLEFRAVAVMACDDEIIPSQARIDSLGDGADLEDLYNTERHLLYVACTRARDRLLVTGVAPASEFLDDLKHQPPTG